MSLKLKNSLLISWASIFITCFSSIGIAQTAANAATLDEQLLNEVQNLQVAQQKKDANDPILLAINRARTNKKVSTDDSADNIASAHDQKPSASKEENYKSENKAAVNNSSNTYGPTTPNEHLWQIATKVKPNSCSVAKTAVAIFQSNRSAFGANINQLKAGSTLAIPSANDIGAISDKNVNDILDGKSLPVVHKDDYARARFVSTIAVKHNIASQNKLNKSSQLTAMATEEKSKPITTVSKVPPANQKLDALSQELSNQERASQIFAIQSMMRINELARENIILNERVSSTEHQLKDVKTDLEKVKEEQIRLGRYSLSGLIANVSDFNKSMEQRLGKNLYYGMIGGGFILLVLLVAIFGLIGRKKYKYQLPEDYTAFPAQADSKSLAEEGLKDIQVPNLAKDEYDFLASPEGIAAKLDLARIYIDMGDREKAEAQLKEVLANGDEEQKKEANKLLEKVAKLK